MAEKKNGKFIDEKSWIYLETYLYYNKYNYDKSKEGVMSGFFNEIRVEQ